MEKKIYEHREYFMVEHSHFFRDIIPILFGKTVKTAFVQGTTENIWVETIKLWKDRKICIKTEIYKSKL